MVLAFIYQYTYVVPYLVQVPVPGTVPDTVHLYDVLGSQPLKARRTKYHYLVRVRFRYRYQVPEFLEAPWRA